MIAIFLLICVSCVGVLGVVAMGRAQWKHFSREREARSRITARVVAAPQPVGDITGVIARLEESAQFQRVAGYKR